MNKKEKITFVVNCVKLDGYTLPRVLCHITLNSSPLSKDLTISVVVPATTLWKENGKFVMSYFGEWDIQTHGLI